jgi:DNA-binding NarL/FixJ family response regulator
VVSKLLGKPERNRLDDLTPREREVLELMAQGHTNVGIAERLELSPSGVEKHVHNVFAKLGLPPTGQYHRRVLAVLAYLGV